MRFFTLYSNSHQYHHLPDFSRFILQEQLDNFLQVQLQIAREIELPMLRPLSQYSEQHILEYARVANTIFLTNLAENKGREHIENSLKTWENDELKIIGKFDFNAEDVTLINYVRSTSFRRLIPLFTTDLNTALELTDEIESFLTGSITAGVNTYFRILRDQITKNEKELLDAQQLANLGNFEWDLVTNKVNNSPEIYRIYGIDNYTGPNEFMQYIHPGDIERVKNNMAKAMTDGSYEHEYRFVKDGTTKYIFSKGVVIYADGKPVRVRGTVQNISDRKKIEQELLEKTVALERSNESLQQFAQVASHDLKEPLRKISLLTDQVLRREKNLSDSSEATLQKAHQSSLRMLQMIDDIMNYSTITHWEEPTETALGEVINEATDFLEQTITEKNAKISHTDLPRATVIRSQIRQLLQNLIANALKFSRPGIDPHITISAAQLPASAVQIDDHPPAGKYLKVSVTDNGIGFDQKFARQIFNLFSRLNSKSAFEGSGLGLAIAKRIIEHHKGTIEATSTPGVGTTISFIIPQ